MAILVNNETGLAENVADQQTAIKSGQYSLPIVDEQGNLGSASYDEIPDLMAQGYSKPTPEHLNQMMEYAKYSTPTEKAKTAVEGLISGAFPLGSGTAAEVAFFNNSEEIRKRKEINPGVHTTSEIAGLIGSELIPGVGQANLLTKAGKAVSEGLKLGKEASILSNVGSFAAKGAVENALYQTGSEISKAIVSDDPNSVYQHALSEIGLSAALGAGLMAPFGAVSPLFRAAKESDLAKFLSRVKDRANGLDVAALPSTLDDAIEKTGIEIAPEVRAGIGKDPALRSAFQLLQESQTASGVKAQEALSNFKNQVNDSVLKSLVNIPSDIVEKANANPGKDIIGDYARSHVEGLKNLSEFKLGEKVAETLAKEIDEKYAPLKAAFDEKKAKFSKAEVSTESKASIANELNSKSNELGLSFVPGSPQESLINKAITGLNKVKTLEDLNKLRSGILLQATEQPMWQTGKVIRKAFNDAEESIFEASIAEKNPELLDSFKASRAKYGEFRELIDSLNDRAHVGKYFGPETFVKSLKEMEPEKLLRRLSKESDVGLIDMLSNQFPKTSELVKDYHLSDLLKTASIGAKEGSIINPSKIFSALDKWSPELKKYVVPMEATSTIENARKLLEALPNRLNTSGTARTLDALSRHVPAGIGGVIGALTGPGAAAGYLIGELSRKVARDAPDAIKLAMLKFLGSDAPISAGAFKSAVDFAQAAINGYKVTEKAVKSVLKAGTREEIKVLPESYMPTEKKRERLDFRLRELQTNAEPLLNVGGEKGYYLPDHGAAAGATTARAVQYLNSLRPNDSEMGPLDQKFEPSPVEKSNFDRALDVAEQPLITLKSVRDGTLTPQDIEVFKNCYPEFYSSISQKLMNEVIESKSKGNDIPYPTRLSLSLFLGQSLDSTMTPQAILSNQAQDLAQNSDMTNIPLQKTKGSMKSLEKYSLQFGTSSQARELKKSSDIS